MTTPDRGRSSTSTRPSRRQVSLETTGEHKSATGNAETSKEAPLSQGTNIATMWGEGGEVNGHGGVLGADVVTDTRDGILPVQLEKSVVMTTRSQGSASRSETSSSSPSVSSKTHIPHEEETEGLSAKRSDAYGLSGDETETSVSEWDSFDDWDESGESSAVTSYSETSNEADNPNTVIVTACETPTDKVDEDEGVNTRNTKDWSKSETAVLVPRQPPPNPRKTTGGQSNSKYKRKHRLIRHDTRDRGKALVKGDSTTPALHVSGERASALDDASLNRSLTVLLTELGLYQSVQRTAVEHHLPANLKDGVEVEKMQRAMTFKGLPPRMDQPHFSPTFVELGGPGKGPTVSSLRALLSDRIALC